MRQAVQTAHADVRENILSLRTTLSDEKGLASAIKEYLDEFEIQTGVSTEFTYRVDGDAQPGIRGRGAAGVHPAGGADERTQTCKGNRSQGVHFPRLPIWRGRKS